MYRLCIFVIIGSFAILQGVNCQQAIGDACTFEGQRGRCSLIQSCPEAIAALRMGRRPTLCFFMGVTPVACCVSSRPSTTRAPATTLMIPQGSNNRCPAVPGVINRKNGRKAWDRCIDLAEVIYPCQPDNIFLLNPTYRRRDTCSHNAVPLIIGGTPAERNEFPHMAMLGFGDMPSIAWDCAGTLISSKWVMTAGHCLLSRQYGPVKYIRLGSPNKQAQIETEYLYNIARTVPHPDYVGSSTYNDISLLETDRVVTFNERVIPACLHTGEPVNDERFIATGWGDTGTEEGASSVLLKVTLEKFSLNECSPKNPPNRRLRDGIRDATQLCAGHRTERRDTCQGDSGGPLQIYNTGVNCTYLVMGITSFGRGCGVVDQPAVYTRVSAFVPWIESVVWP